MKALPLFACVALVGGACGGSPPAPAAGGTPNTTAAVPVAPPTDDVAVSGSLPLLQGTAPPSEAAGSTAPPPTAPDHKGEDASALSADPLAGKPAPALDAARVDAEGRVTLRRLKGKVAIVHFWATWCAPCARSLPALQRLADAHAGAIAVVAVAEDDDKNDLAPFLKQVSTHFPVVWDARRQTAAKWRPESMPATYVLDKNLVIRFVHRGYSDTDETRLEAEIKSLL